jgi:uncharacterized membrane protein YhaH (DUF805 family)
MSAFGYKARMGRRHYMLSLAAFGAFLLAVAANVHGQWLDSGHQRALAIALLAWPVLVAVPAFLATLIASAALGLRRKS